VICYSPSTWIPFPRFEFGDLAHEVAHQEGDQLVVEGA
jgi:hypothetical protein